MNPEIHDDKQRSSSLAKCFLMDRPSYRIILRSSMRDIIKKHGCLLIRVYRTTAREISGYFAMQIYYCMQRKPIMKQAIRQKHLNISTWYVQGQEVPIILFFPM